MQFLKDNAFIYLICLYLVICEYNALYQKLEEWQKQFTEDTLRLADLN